jgi:nucleotide-binding universal stress UspA family protein
MPPELPLKAEIAEANAYLAQVTSSDDLAGIDIQTSVLTGSPAQAIVLFEQLQHIDLTIMCSHGFTGFKRWWFGSVAQHVLRHSPAPVLVLREGGLMLPTQRKGSNRPLRVLVALDGSALAETALVPAAHLSAILSAPAAGVLHLVRVLPLPELVDDSQKEILLPARKVAASEVAAYLDTVKQRLQVGDLAKLGLIVTSSVVVHTDVADTLIWEAKHGEFVGDSAVCDDYDMIAMATHGRGGPQRWFVGSITERVLGATRLPLLIVRSHCLR